MRGYYLRVNCYLCQEFVPLHALCLDSEWVLVCMLCDSRDDDRDGAPKILDDLESEGSKANGPTDI